MEKGKEKEIRDLLIFGDLRPPDPDLLSLTWGELVRVATEAGFPAAWWRKKDARPIWIKVSPGPGPTLAAARKIARKNPVADPERQFVRETLGQPPFGLPPGGEREAREENKNASNEGREEKSRSGGPGLFEALFG